ncbi:hypothetical protein Dimus_009742 [Dionaea muscipula]
MVEFCSMESGCLGDGRIKILTDVVTPLFIAFKLRVGGKVFDCWVVVDGSVDMQLVQSCLDFVRLPGSGPPWEEPRSNGLSPEAAMADPLVKHRVHDSLGRFICD